MQQNLFPTNISGNAENLCHQKNNKVAYKRKTVLSHTHSQHPLTISRFLVQPKVCWYLPYIRSVFCPLSPPKKTEWLGFLHNSKLKQDACFKVQSTFDSQSFKLGPLLAVTEVSAVCFSQLDRVLVCESVRACAICKLVGGRCRRRLLFENYRTFKVISQLPYWIGELKSVLNWAITYIFKIIIYTKSIADMQKTITFGKFRLRSEGHLSSKTKHKIPLNKLVFTK